MQTLVDFTPIEKLIKNPKKIPAEVVDVLQAWAEQVETYGIERVRLVSSFNDHPLKGNRKGERSIRLNYKWRAIYTESSMNKYKIVKIEEITPHDYRKK